MIAKLTIQEYREQLLAACPGRTVFLNAQAAAYHHTDGSYARRTCFTASVLPGFDGTACQGFEATSPELAIAQAAAAATGDQDLPVAVPVEEASE